MSLSAQQRLVFKSSHQKRVERFMALAGQEVPDTVKIPNEDTRVLRAKLILEEAFETINALGVDIFCDNDLAVTLRLEDIELLVSEDRDCDLAEVVDGCCDIIVVTTGTLSAFGVIDELCQSQVDNANLRKFGPGGHRREDGKWIKPPDWQAPDWKQILSTQGWNP